MNYDIVRIVLVLFQILILGYIIIVTGRRARSMRSSIVMVLFIYGIVCFLLCGFYWLVHVSLREEARIPFGVNEIGEIGVHLLFASMLNALMKDAGRPKGSLPKIIAAAIYSAVMVALWIGWTGEWVKDILAGIGFGYLICTGIGSLDRAGAFSKLEWIILGIMSYVLIALQGLIFILPATTGGIVDIACYCLMFAGIAWLAIRTINAFIFARRQKDRKSSVNSLVILMICFIWISNTMYMSSEPMYFIAVFTMTLLLILFPWAVIGTETAEEGTQDDLC